MEVLLDRYDPLIYPIKIYVAISPNLYNITKQFKTPILKRLTRKWGKKDRAVTYSYIRDKDYNYCILTVFRDIEYCTAQTMAHEIAHIVELIWEHIGETKFGSEANAYLTGWIAKCVLETTNKLKT